MPLYSDITLLVTHYNRSKSLDKLLKKVRELDLNFAEIIVSDDGSKTEHLQYLDYLATEYGVTVVKTPVNKGLGNNINKGHDHVKTDLVLYIQEDFVPNSLFVDKLKVAHAFMLNDSELDFVRFYAYYKFPNLKPVSDGFSEMTFSHLKFWQGYRKFYLYSDHPHLHRKSFLERFGRYDEGIKPDRTEYNMMMKVLAQNPKAYFYEDHYTLLTQENSHEEPSTIKRNFLRNNNSIFAILARSIYRYLRFYLELIVFKLKPKK